MTTATTQVQVQDYVVTLVGQYRRMFFDPFGGHYQTHGWVYPQLGGKGYAYEGAENASSYAAWESLNIEHNNCSFGFSWETDNRKYEYVDIPLPPLEDGWVKIRSRTVLGRDHREKTFLCCPSLASLPLSPEKLEFLFHERKLIQEKGVSPLEAAKYHELIAGKGPWYTFDHIEKLQDLIPRWRDQRVTKLPEIVASYMAATQRSEDGAADAIYGFLKRFPTGNLPILEAKK